MATGVLGAVDIDGTTNAINTDILVYTVPASTIAYPEFVVVNRNAAGTATKVRVAVTSGGAPVAADYQIYDYSLDGSGTPISRTPFVMQAGYKIYFRSDVTNANIVVTGPEVAA